MTAPTDNEVQPVVRICTVTRLPTRRAGDGLVPEHYQYAHTHRGDPGPADRFAPIDHEVFAESNAQAWYWVGFLGADGCVSDTGMIYLRLAERDLDHIKAFRSFVCGERHRLLA